MPARVRSLVLWVVALALWGCATGTVRTPYDPGRAGPTLPVLADPFPYVRAAVPVANRELREEETADYVVRFLSMPSAGDNGQPGNLVTARYYQRKGSGPRSLVIILPIWGGHTYPSWIVARDLIHARRGDVMLIEGDEPIIDWSALANARAAPEFARLMQRMVERVRVSVIDIRRVMDWAEQRPGVDGRRLALIGFSESGLQVAGVLASDRRPAAAVLVMAGAHPQEMLATCYGPPAEIRRRVLPRFGWSVAEYAAALAPLMAPVDPARLGSRVDPARVLVFDAREDDCISRSGRDALWHALGCPERISVRSSHAGAFLAMTFLGGDHVRSSIQRFLARRLG